MLSWAVMISLCHADMRLPGYLSWNVSFDGADLSAPSRKELVHTSMLCQHFKRRDDGTGICLFHSAVMPEAFLIPEEICQWWEFCTNIPVGNTQIIPVGMPSYDQVETASPGTEFCLTRVPSFQDLKAAFPLPGRTSFSFTGKCDHWHVSPPSISCSIM